MEGASSYLSHGLFCSSLFSTLRAEMVGCQTDSLRLTFAPELLTSLTPEEKKTEVM